MGCSSRRYVVCGSDQQSRGLQDYQETCLWRRAADEPSAQSQGFMENELAKDTFCHVYIDSEFKDSNTLEIEN